MSICYYLAPQVTVTGPGGQPTQVPMVATHPINAYSSAASQASWALCIVDADDQTLIQADSLVSALPEVPLDTTYGSLPGPLQQALSRALRRFGLGDIPLLSTTTLRDILQAIGVRQYPSFRVGDLAASVLS